MFAVIFKARVKAQDADYSIAVERMRELAFEKYSCIDFIAVTEGDQEIAISYWHTEEDIKRWKADPEHQLAQENGRRKWYLSYSVQVVEVIREYQSN